ncbi:MAG: tetratricopeptide repeat protein [Defluviitaleaceae bacterium]|nr:tetratricopeptide repeat protein [Defluviitaleaceae bacterium]
MTKIGYLRRRLNDEYHKRNLPRAADIGDALLKEHMTNHFASPGYANDLFNVALVYDELGELERAASMYAASIRHICGHGRQLPQTIFLHSLSDAECLALSMRFNNLAGVLAQMGDYDQAREMYTWVRGLNSRAQPGHMQAVSDNLYNMGNVAACVNNKDEALRLHGQALIQRKQDGAAQDVINSLHSLANIYEQTGEYEKAIPFAESALEYSKGGIHAGACCYLAELYELNCQHDKALELYEKVLEEISETGCMRRDYMTVLNRQAYLTGMAGDTNKAITLHKEVFDMYNSLTGLDLGNMDVAFYPDSLRNMAMLNNSIGETSLAEDYMLESIKTRREAGGEDINDICFLIRMYLKNDDYDKLMGILIYALSQAGGPKSPNATATIDAILDSFSDAENTHMLLAAIKDVNDTDVIRSFLDMWRDKDGFM